MPKKVVIGCYTWDVEIMNPGDAWSTFGHMNSMNNRIRVAPNQTPEQLGNTFFHEVLHAIHWLYGCSEDSSEEDFTNQGTNGICAFARENPDAWVWFTQMISKQ